VKRRLDLGIAALLVAAAVAVRMSSLGPSSLWLDDAWVGFVHRADWSDLADMGLTSPGFLFVMKAWFGVFGFSELGAQIPAFLAGVVGPVVLFGLLRRRTRRCVAVAASALLVLAPAHVTYSTHAKQYTLEVVLGLVIIWAALRVGERPDSNRRWWSLAAVSVVGPLVSFVVVSISACAVGSALVAARSDRQKLGTASIGATVVSGVVPALLYLTVVRENASSSLRLYWAGNYIDESSPASALRTSAERIHDLSESLFSLPAELMVIVVALCFGALAWRRPGVFVMTAGPLALAFVMAVLDYAPLGGGRTDIYLIAPVFTGVALGAEVMLDELRLPQRRSVLNSPMPAALAVTALVAGSFLALETADYPSEDVRPLIELMETQRQPGDVVFLYYRVDRAYSLYADVEVEVLDGTPYEVAFADELVVTQAWRERDPVEQLLLSLEPDELTGRIWLIGTHFRSDWDGTADRLASGLGREELGRWTSDGAEMVLFAGS